MIDKHPSKYKRKKSADNPGTSLTPPHSLPIFPTVLGSLNLLERVLKLKVRRGMWCVVRFLPPLIFIGGS